MHNLQQPPRFDARDTVKTSDVVFVILYFMFHIVVYVGVLLAIFVSMRFLLLLIPLVIAGMLGKALRGLRP